MGHYKSFLCLTYQLESTKCEIKPVAILAKDLGTSLAAYRLSRNLRQDDIATQAGVSRGVIVRLEAGQGGTLDSLIRILKAMGLEERLSALVPDATLRPLDPGNRTDLRQRARLASDVDDNDEPWTWSE